MCSEDESERPLLTRLTWLALAMHSWTQSTPSATCPPPLLQTRDGRQRKVAWTTVEGVIASCLGRGKAKRGQRRAV